MKKIIYFLFISLLIISCKESKDYVSLKGQLTNYETIELEIVAKNYSKTISLNEDGTFQDTLKVEKGLYSLTDGKNKALLFLKNGYDLTINTDITDFENATIEGTGMESNHYILNKINSTKSDLYNAKSYFLLDREAFDSRMDELIKLNSSFPLTNVDSLLIAQVENDNSRFVQYLTKNYETKHSMMVKFAKGKPSPKFVNFENYAGGKTSMDDLRGKYIYIDVWATWCGPCKTQIPFLKEIEKQYEHKNIEFVSISTDRRNKYDAWRKMIEDKQMSGVQLYAGEDRSFSNEYQINSIPRFILIDPEGNILDADAPRPSDPRLKELFNSLSI
jgi:thiol-disulfide isomerase/thioredoxin